MKLIYIPIILLFLGCSSNQSDVVIDKNMNDIDSIINQSQINIITSDSINRESEKTVAKKVDQTVNKIDGLKEEVLTLKQEIQVAKMAVKTIYKVDTVYIETKKNFWGREKTSSSIKSDSAVIIDSLQNN